MPDYKTLDAYADHIRIEAGRIMSALFSELGTSHPQALAVARLHEEAANILTGREMEAERAEVEELDLDSLALLELRKLMGTDERYLRLMDYFHGVSQYEQNPDEYWINLCRLSCSALNSGVSHEEWLKALHSPDRVNALLSLIKK